MVNFYDAYDPVCHELDPKIDQLAEEKGKYTYLKVEINENNAGILMLKYNVEKAPTILVIKDDKVLKRLDEAPTDEELKELMS